MGILAGRVLIFFQPSFVLPPFRRKIVFKNEIPSLIRPFLLFFPFLAECFFLLLDFRVGFYGM